MALVDSSIESIEKVGAGKKKTLDNIMMVMNYKMQMAEAGQMQA
jgi:hypothetical protein